MEKTLQATSYWARAEQLFISGCSDNGEALERIRQKASEEPCSDDPQANTDDSQLYFRQILRVAANKKTEMEAKQWTFPYSFRGKELKVREALDRTCEKAKIFKHIGDGLSSIDSLHAGTPWAAITLVLDVSPQSVTSCVLGHFECKILISGFELLADTSNLSE